MFNGVVNWVLGVMGDFGYSGVAILMAIESSFLPLPSELVIPPAAWLASEGRLSLFWVIVAGTLGSVIGASFNYWLSYWLGRLVIYKLANHKIARALHINPEKISKAEKYFLKNADYSTFTGRLIPVVRHLISIPAGFSKMPFGRFIFFTAAGSLVWVSVLAALGYYAGANRELLHRYYQEIKWALLFIGALWIYFTFIRKKPASKQDPK